MRFSFVLAGLLAGGAAGGDLPRKLDYGRDVRPILSENCFPCHGQDSKNRMAGLRLDTFEGATALRSGRAAIVPGQPGASELFRRITAQQPGRRMPPVSSHRSLTAEQIATLRQWIEQGATYSPHWAFQPPQRPPLPRTADASWLKQPLDAFVSARLQEESLKPSPPAPPGKWLRRVSLDLTGLPPAPAEIDKFAQEVERRGEAAYAAAVDRLLASPRFGERMAMDWLDVARYADTHGFNNDAARSMWRWRDWVINSFNANLPYDRFLTEQLAGDLLPNATLDQRVATGYGRNHVINSEGGIIEEEYRVEYVFDRVRTLGLSWLGLTLECARCHDHKYDPITQRDYYRFFAFFNNIPEFGEDGRVGNAVPLISAPTASQLARMRDIEAEMAVIEACQQRRERRWKWDVSVEKKIAARGAGPLPVEEPVFRLDCESADGFSPKPERETPAPGIAGRACVPATLSPKARTAKGVFLSKRSPFSFSAWVRPAPGDTNAALLSTIDYAANPAATTYGRGVEFRLRAGELEFTYSDRFPAYSLRVRSIGAKLGPEQWRHVAVLYAGAPQAAVRAEAAWVRMFVDGIEVPIRIINDGLGLPEASQDDAPPWLFQLGWDSAPHSKPFLGQLDEVSFWTRCLQDAEVEAVFQSRAIPYALSRQRQGQASRIETDWLRQAVLSHHDEYAAGRRRLHALRSELLAIQRHAPTVMVMEEMPVARETRILLRGAYNAPGETVEPGVPEAILGPWPEGAPKNRLGLAQWLTHPRHPLTARVVVNRFWQHLFGTGIVKTSENFGFQGEWPSHPELLDWLAVEFIESGWNVKALLRQIVLSATYRQDSAATPEAYAKDPENRLLARGPRVRLPAEIIRDQALALAGLLSHRLGGPSVFPYQVPDLYKGIVVAADYPGTRYVESKGEDLYRRSLYTFWKRTIPHPTMTVFDAPDRETCVVRRSTTNTPLQALTLLNDPIFVEAARKLAERAIREGGRTIDDQLAYAFRLATGRRVERDEAEVLRQTYLQMLSAYRAEPRAGEALLTVGASRSSASIDRTELAALTVVANLILNLDEVLTKG